MIIKKLLLIGLIFGCALKNEAQSFNQGDIIINGNIGTPHLFKGIIKIAANSNAFKENFGNVLEISSIKGFNPMAIKTEYGINEVFGLGINYSYIVEELFEGSYKPNSKWKEAREFGLDIAPEQPIVSIEEALINSSIYKSVDTHLNQAIQHLSDKIKPDYRNSMTNES